MPSPRSTGQARRAAQRRAARRARRFASLIVLAGVVTVTLLLTAFGSGETTPVASTLPEPAPIVAPGPPEPQVVALHGSLRLQLPVAQAQVTAIGYHAVDGALRLEPLGRQGNRGLLGRLVDRIVGESDDELVFYDLGGTAGPSRSALDVGAAPGTDVFAPVDGTVIGITPVVLNGKRFGARVDIQPSTAPSVVVSVTRVRPDPALTVGSAVVAGVFKIGSVLDLSRVEKQALARFTQDAGNHVSIEVRPAATLSLP